MENRERRKEWDFLLLHTAELDHEVHLKHLSTYKIQEILRKEERMFRDLIEKVPENVTLIVTSDHGLIESGHGGDSEYEKQSMLFVYNKNGLGGKSESLKQMDGLDLTTTLHYLMGLPLSLN